MQEDNPLQRDIQMHVCEERERIRKRISVLTEQSLLRKNNKRKSRDEQAVQTQPKVWSGLVLISQESGGNRELSPVDAVKAALGVGAAFGTRATEAPATDPHKPTSGGPATAKRRRGEGVGASCSMTWVHARAAARFGRVST